MGEGRCNVENHVQATQSKSAPCGARETPALAARSTAAAKWPRSIARGIGRRERDNHISIRFSSSDCPLRTPALPDPAFSDSPRTQTPRSRPPRFCPHSLPPHHSITPGQLGTKSAPRQSPVPQKVLPKSPPQMYRHSLVPQKGADNVDAPEGEALEIYGGPARSPTDPQPHSPKPKTPKAPRPQCPNAPMPQGPSLPQNLPGPIRSRRTCRRRRKGAAVEVSHAKHPPRRLRCSGAL
jgi:hypothetical protein